MRVALRAGLCFRAQSRDGTVFDRYERVLLAKMHADEVDITTRIWCGVCRVHNSQWADLPIAPVRSAGTTTQYRLGDLAVRIPRIGWAESLRTEQQWLLRIKLRIQARCAQFRWPGARLRPGWPWSVCRCRGENLSAEFAESPPGPFRLDFITACHAGGPPAKRCAAGGAGCRGTRSAGGLPDGSRRPRGQLPRGNCALTRTLRMRGRWMWFHDLSWPNILTAQGRLTGVIDFGLDGSCR